MSVHDREGESWQPRPPEPDPPQSDVTTMSPSALTRLYVDLRHRVAQLEAEVIELHSSITDLRAGR